MASKPKSTMVLPSFRNCAVASGQGQLGVRGDKRRRLFLETLGVFAWGRFGQGAQQLAQRSPTNSTFCNKRDSHKTVHKTDTYTARRRAAIPEKHVTTSKLRFWTFRTVAKAKLDEGVRAWTVAFRTEVRDEFGAGGGRRSEGSGPGAGKHADKQNPKDLAVWKLSHGVLK